MTRKRVTAAGICLAVGFLAARPGAPARADAKGQAAREVAEYVAGRFGRQAVREGTPVLARRIEAAAAVHGGEVFEAVRKVGPRALALVEGAGARGGQAARVLGRHGEPGAAWVVSRPKAMGLVARHGDDAASVLVKHAGGIAEPVVERFGPPAVRALGAVGPRSGRRLAMMVADGDLARIGRTEELLEVVARYGDRAMEFVWEHKGALAVTATLAGFLVDPEPFLSGAKDITRVVAENAVKPLAEVPAVAAREAAGEVARKTNWTVVFGLGVLALGALAALRVLRSASPVNRSATPPSTGGEKPCP